MYIAKRPVRHIVSIVLLRCKRTNGFLRKKVTHEKGTNIQVPQRDPVWGGRFLAERVDKVELIERSFHIHHVLV